MVTRIIAFLLLLGAFARAEDQVTTYTFTNQYTALNPERTVTGTVSRSIRVSIWTVDGASAPYDLSASGIVVRAAMTQSDGGTNNQSFSIQTNNAALGSYRITWTPNVSGNARLSVQAYQGTTLLAEIASHYVTINAEAADTVSISLVPLQDGIGHIGTDSLRWGQIYSGTVTAHKVIVEGDLDVSGAISAIDTGKVALTGDTMTGALTSPAYYGSARGLTNFPIIYGVTNQPAGTVWTNASGTVVLIGTNPPPSASSDFEFIMSASATNGASSITFAAIPQTYHTLILVGTIAVTGTYNGAAEVVCRLNNDTNGFYGTGRWGQENTATHVAHQRAATYGYLAQAPSQMQPGVGMFRAEFPAYTNTSMNHGWFGNYGAASGTSTGHYSGTVSSQLSYNANPVTSIVLWAVGFGLSSNTQIIALGVKDS